MSFAKYAALVKNLRGVVIADLDEEGVWDSVKWLIKRFRYRDLGVTPSVVNKYRDKLAQYLNGNPFVELSLPINAINYLVEILSKIAQIRIEVAELLVYSSTYISPAMVIGFSYLNYFKNLATDTVNICKDLDINSWKLHLRIADYAILDFYRECVEEMVIMLRHYDINEKAKLLKEIVMNRKIRILKDKKRYWRIACNNGKPFLFYIDMGVLVYNYNLLQYLEVDHAAGLAIVPLIIIPPNLK